MEMINTTGVVDRVSQTRTVYAYGSGGTRTTIQNVIPFGMYEIIYTPGVVDRVRQTCRVKAYGSGENYSTDCYNLWNVWNDTHSGRC